MPANDLKELIAWLKANPDKASMGTVGAGSPGHLLGLLMQQETGTRFGLVAYRGAGPQTQPGGGTDRHGVCQSGDRAAARACRQDVKALAVTAKNRLAVAPGIPSVDEARLPRLYFSLWAGLFAPRGTPNHIIGTLNSAAVVHWAMAPFARSLPPRALSFQRASNRPRRRSPPIRKRRSRNGGRSSRQPASSRNKQLRAPSLFAFAAAY